MINVHSFIAEVKSKRRWRPRKRGGCLTPPSRKPHGKNILKCRSIKDGPLRTSDCIAFVTFYQKDSPLRRSSECIAFVTFCQKDGPLRSSEYALILCRKYQTTWRAARGRGVIRGRRARRGRGRGWGF